MEIITHKQAKADLEGAYLTLTGDRFEDPDRAIRSLFDEGFLEKISNGKYMYNPDTAGRMDFVEFTQTEKELIFKRDGYLCVWCGLGRANGVELHADHIKPRSLGGLSTIENGQTLCARHNFIKKNLSQTETGKKSFIRMLDLVKTTPDDPVASELQDFLIEVLKVYEKHGINGHIRWDGSKPEEL